MQDRVDRDGEEDDRPITPSLEARRVEHQHREGSRDRRERQRRGLGASAGDIESVHIATYAPALAVAGNPNPQTAAEARFSIPFVVATALLYGSVRLAAFTPERLANTDLRALMQRIKLSVDPVLDAAFPGQRAARVVIRSRQGQEASHLQPTRKGDPDLPLTDGDLDDKFMELASPVMGDTRAGALLQQLWHLEQRQDLRLF